MPTFSSLTRARFSQAGEQVRLVVVDGPDRGTVQLVGEAPVRIGSAADGGLVLTDPSVSRNHAEVRWRGRFLELTDLGSKNGSFVGDNRAHRVDLPSGSEFRIGTSTLKVVPDEQPIEPAPSAASASGALVGTSTVMRQLFTLLDQLARSDVSVLVEGETGTGKELVAEEIHRRSARSARPFVVFDCGVVADELVESTLFGHVRGAFTGATTDKTGLFSDADGGTVFVDELGELALDLQPALLRVLDRKMIRPVGATAFRTVDVRVIAATHRDLGVAIDDGRFREDLYYRLAVVRINVPALRERPEDIPLLVRHFLRDRKTIDDATMQRLVAHAWPGNVRELRNVVEGAVALSRGDALEVGELGRGRSRPEPSAPSAPSVIASFRDAKASALEAFERGYLTDLVQRHATLAAAADAASMDRKHLRTLLKRYGLRDE